MKAVHYRFGHATYDDGRTWHWACCGVRGPGLLYWQKAGDEVTCKRCLRQREKSEAMMRKGRGRP